MLASTVADLIRLLASNPQHKYVYHFTDKSNFPLIKKHGILSKDAMRTLGIGPVAPGGNDWSWQADDHKGISDYVSLCLTRSHPMCYVARSDGRIKDPRYLGISPEILRTPGVLIATDIANKRDVDLHSLADGISLLDLEIIYTRTDWRIKSFRDRLEVAEKYEILIPTKIGVKFIKEVF